MPAGFPRAAREQDARSKEEPATEEEGSVKRQAWLRLTLLPALALTAGLVLVRPHTLWAQGAPRLFLALTTGSQERPNPVDTPAVALALFTLTADHKLNY